MPTEEDDPGEPPPPPGLVAVAEPSCAFNSSAFPPVVPEAHSGMFRKQMAAPDDPFPFLGNVLQIIFKYKDCWLTHSDTWECQFSTLILHMHSDGTTNGGVNFRNRGWHGDWRWSQQDQSLQVRMHHSAQDTQSGLHSFYREADSGKFTLSRSCGFSTARWDTSMELHRTVMLTKEGWSPVPPPPDHPIIKDVNNVPTAMVKDGPRELSPPPALVAVAERTWAFNLSASDRAGSEGFPPVVPEAHSGMFREQMAAPEDPFPFLGIVLQIIFKYEDRSLTKSDAWKCKRSTLILHMHLDGTTNGGVNFANRGWHGAWRWSQQDQCLQVGMHHSAQDTQSKVYSFYRETVSGKFTLSRSCGISTAHVDTTMELHRTVMLTNEGWSPVPPPPDHPIIKDVNDAPTAFEGCLL